MLFLSKVGREFKEFAVKGNVVDLAVGVIIGAAFGKVVSSLVNDIIMPPIAALTRGFDFQNWKLVLSRGSEGNPDVALRYGAFVQVMIEFLIVAWAVFFLVKGINKLRRHKEEAEVKSPPTPPKQEQLLTEIRDILKQKS